MSATQTPAASKKRKIEPPKDGPPANVHSPVLWFDDGTIITQAEITQFRVYREFVARHSEVFRSTFTIPQPPDEYSIEQCRVVHVSDDRARDWEYPLKAMYNCFKWDIENSCSTYYVKNSMLILFILYFSNQQVRKASRAIPCGASHIVTPFRTQIRLQIYRDIAVRRLKVILPVDSHTAWISNQENRSKYVAGYIFELVNVIIEVGWTYVLLAVYFLCIRETKVVSTWNWINSFLRWWGLTMPV